MWILRIVIFIHIYIYSGCTCSNIQGWLAEESKGFDRMWMCIGRKVNTSLQVVNPNVEAILFGIGYAWVTTNIHKHTKCPCSPTVAQNEKKVWQFLLWVWCGMSHWKSLSHPSAEQCNRLHKNRFNPRDSSRETSMMQALMCIYRDWMNTTFITWPLLINPQPMFGASWFSQLHRRPAQRAITMGAHGAMHPIYACHHWML